MSFSSNQSSLKRPPSLPHLVTRQDTVLTMSSFSSSCSQLDTLETGIASNSSSLRSTKVPRKSKKRNREHHVFLPGMDEKTLRTLKQHYYPEHYYYGYFVTFIGTLVQTLTHGLHMSYGIFLLKLINVFGTPLSTGNKTSSYFFLLLYEKKSISINSEPTC